MSFRRQIPILEEKPKCSFVTVRPLVSAVEHDESASVERSDHGIQTCYVTHINRHRNQGNLIAVTVIIIILCQVAEYANHGQTAKLVQPGLH